MVNLKIDMMMMKRKLTKDCIKSTKNKKELEKKRKNKNSKKRWLSVPSNLIESQRVRIKDLGYYLREVQKTLKKYTMANRDHKLRVNLTTNKCHKCLKPVLKNQTMTLERHQGQKLMSTLKNSIRRRMNMKPRKKKD